MMKTQLNEEARGQQRHGLLRRRMGLRELLAVVPDRVVYVLNVVLSA